MVCKVNVSYLLVFCRNCSIKRLTLSHPPKDKSVINQQFKQVTGMVCLPRTAVEGGDWGAVCQLAGYVSPSLSVTYRCNSEAKMHICGQ